MREYLNFGLVGLIVILMFVVGIFLTIQGKNKSFETELTWDQMKDYFLKKHECKDCNAKLIRVKEDEYLGEGWTHNIRSSFYSRKYKRTYYLKCPNCNRMYTSDDY